MWLHAAMSNNNPEYIATYFVECVRTVGGKIDTTTLIMINVVDLIGCPKILRTDPGTEIPLLLLFSLLFVTVEMIVLLD